MVGLDNLLAKPLEQSLARRQPSKQLLLTVAGSGGAVSITAQSCSLCIESPAPPSSPSAGPWSQGRKWELVCDPLDPRGGRELGTETPRSCVVPLFVQGLAHGEGYTSVFLE